MFHLVAVGDSGTESSFNRLKDFRRIATRYDRLARNYLASVCLAAALAWWI
jgi:transposase